MWAEPGGGNGWSQGLPKWELLPQRWEAVSAPSPPSPHSDLYAYNISVPRHGSSRKFISLIPESTFIWCDSIDDEFRSKGNITPADRSRRAHSVTRHAASRIQRPLCDKMASSSHFVAIWPDQQRLLVRVPLCADLAAAWPQPSWRHRNGLFRCPSGSGSRPGAPPDGRQAIGTSCRRASDLARWRLLRCRSSTLPVVMKPSAVCRYQRLGGVW